MYDNCINSASMPQCDVSPIESAARELSQRIEFLHDQLSNLRSRLELVSMPQVDELTKAVVGAMPQAMQQSAPTSPLETQLRNMAAGVDGASSRITTILTYLGT